MLKGALSSHFDQRVDRASVFRELAGISDRNASRASNEATRRRRQDLERVIVSAFCCWIGKNRCRTSQIEEFERRCCQKGNDTRRARHNRLSMAENVPNVSIPPPESKVRLDGTVSEIALGQIL